MYYFYRTFELKKKCELLLFYCYILYEICSFYKYEIGIEATIGVFNFLRKLTATGIYS